MNDSDFVITMATIPFILFFGLAIMSSLAPVFGVIAFTLSFFGVSLMEALVLFIPKKQEETQTEPDVSCVITVNPVRPTPPPIPKTKSPTPKTQPKSTPKKEIPSTDPQIVMDIVNTLHKMGIPKKDGKKLVLSLCNKKVYTDESVLLEDCLATL